MKRRPTFLMTVLCLGLAFLYAPIVSMMVFSFNGSSLVNVWSGFSTKWYTALWSNRQILNAFLLSLKIALISSTIATILGTMAGIVLARLRYFRGRVLFSGLVATPLIMPEVITGISSLMLFIMMGEWIGWPSQRGFATITLAHITFNMAFVTPIIHARMTRMDVSVEEAAMDLGSRPWQVMWDVTLPMIFPAIVSGWLLAFVMSFDDVVISSFVTGPGYTTLPIYIWSKVKIGLAPDINALATIVVLTVGVGVGLAAWFASRAERKRELDRQLAYRENR